MAPLFPGDVSGGGGGGDLPRDDQLASCGLVLFLSFVVTLLVTRASRRLSPLVSRRDWDTRPASILYSVTVAPLTLHALYELLFVQHRGHGSDACSSTALVRMADWRTSAILAGSLGHFAANALTCAVWKVGDPSTILHHVAGIVSILLSLVHGLAQVYVLCMLATEITTPLVNSRWLLDDAGMTATRAYPANGGGLAMLMMWAAAWKALLFPAYFWLLRDTWPDVREAMPSPHRSLLVGVPATLFGLNLMWFFAIARGSRKVLYRAA